MLRTIFIIPLLFMISGAVFGSTNKTPGRIGIYASFRDEIGSPHKLREAMRAMKAAGIEFILPSGKTTSGTVNWDSKVAPPELIANRTYIETIIKYAHAEGIKVYPVVCVATEGGDNRMNSLLEKNPSWAWFYDGQKRGYIDPANKEARKYILSLIEELARDYDIDGLSLDYMRCPNRVGYCESARQYFLKKRGVDLAELVALSPGTDLDTEGGKRARSEMVSAARSHEVWPEYREWRKAQLNIFAREIKAAVNKAKPGLPISSYCWGYHTYVRNYETCQDWQTWIKEGVLDWINPSGYRYDDESFREAAKANRENIAMDFPMYITIGVKTSHGELPTAADIERHMRMSKEAGAYGLIFFRWEHFKGFLPEMNEAVKSWAD